MSAIAPAANCGTNAGLTQTGGTRTASVAAATLAPQACAPSGPPAASGGSTTGSATSVGLISDTNLANSQAGSISGLAGKAGATLNNSTTSTVAASGDATARTGNVPDGATAGSAPASALGASTTNTVIDLSKVSVSVGGANEAPITVSNQNTRNVQDTASASATSGSAGTAPSVTAAAASPVTTSNAAPAVTTAAVTDAAPPASPEVVSSPAACTGHSASTTITGSAEKTVSAPAASGQPIEIGISQRASTTNTGSTTGVLSLAVPASASGPAPVANGAGGGGTGATARGLSATNTVENTALVDVTIGGSNYAPINIAVRTVTTIVNAAKAVVETAAGGGEGAAGGSASGLGTHASNNISLDGSAAVDIAGDNHNPIRIVLDIGAELWNKGMALLGLSQGTSAPAGASATGLEVENLLKLLGRASVRIGGSNYAPIDIDILLQNLIYNDGIANAGSAASLAGGAADQVRDVSSGPATCATLLTTAGVVNGQVASVKLADDLVRRQVLAGNSNVVDVQGYGTARCSTGDVVGSTGNATSGEVNVAAGGTTLAVVTAQVADASAKTDPAKADDAATVTPGGTGGSGGTGGAGGTAQVVVAVTTKPIKVPAKNSGNRRNIQSSILQEEWTYEWVVVWEPLYVIYPPSEEPEFVAAEQPTEVSDTETTTSMAGSFRQTPDVVTPFVYQVGGLDLISQLQLAGLGLLGFLLLALLKRRLRAAAARKAASQTPELHVLDGGVEAAAD